MPKLISEIPAHQAMIGKRYTCPETGKVWEITEEDVRIARDIKVGLPRNEETVPAIVCPCGKHVFFHKGQLRHL